MNIELSEPQKLWLEKRVREGGFASIDEAVARLIDERMLEEFDDLAWAKPLVDEALDDVASGNIVSHKEYRSDIDKHLVVLKAK